MTIRLAGPSRSSNCPLRTAQNNAATIARPVRSISGNNP
jgi:hypothetical protein